MQRIKFCRIISFAISFAIAVTCIVFPSVNVSAEETYGTTIAVNYNGQIVDTFSGVPARYVLGYSDTGEYCCAGYVSDFYMKKFGVTVYNINIVDDKPSVYCYGAKTELRTVTNVKPGDIMQTKDYTHVAIVKAVNGDDITLIEQNYKWTYNGTVYTQINRHIIRKNYYFYRLYKNGVEQTLSSQETPYVKLSASNLKISKGQSTNLKAELSTGKTQGIMWKSDNSSVANVSSGKITAASAGQATVTAYTNSGSKSTCKVTVTDNISNASAVVLNGGYVGYTGKAVTPKVKLTYSGRTLVNGKDYKVSSKSSSLGTGTATITGLGCFTGTKNVNFKIVLSHPRNQKASSSSEKITVSWNPVTGAQGYIVKAYNNRTKKWVRIYNGKSTDVSINCAAETYKFHITAYKKIGSKTYYSGTVGVGYTSPAATPPEKTYFVGATVDNGNVKFQIHAMKDISGNEILMSDEENGKYVIAGSTSNNMCTIKNIKKYTMKYFKVRAYKTVYGEKIYGETSNPMAVWIK